jgi:HPr kinase/phosphorylase
MSQGGPGGVDASAPPGLPVRRLLAEAERFGLRLHGGEAGLDRRIQDAEVQKPGLVLAGVQPAHPTAVHVLGEAETRYLAVRGRDEQRRVLEQYVDAGVPCVVVTRGVAPSPVMLDVAARRGIPVFGTLSATGAFIRALHAWLAAALSSRVDLHGVLVQVLNLGVLITGESGVGKSETALELVLRGHRLVADDRVRVRRADAGLVGTGVPPLGHYVEVRGLGILHAGDLFGQAAVQERASVDLVCELVAWDAGGFDRTGLDDRTTPLLGVDVPHLRIPVRPGRNLATIVELAVRNQVLKSRGVHSARRFADELEASLRERGGR